MIGSYKIIGVCLSRMQNEDRFHLLEALNQYAAANGYRLIVFNSCSDLYIQTTLNDLSERAVYQLIDYDALECMVIFPTGIFHDETLHEIVSQCSKRNIPVFSVDKEMEGCYNFFFDYSNTFEQICRHVIEHHHCRNVFMMAGMRNNDFSNTRLEAYRKVLEDNGIPYLKEKVGYGEFWDGPTREHMIRWFEEEKREFPDAIICANDVMAIVVSNYLQDHGCRVPEDCIVTGFDGIMQIKYYLPHLTTGTQDYDAMGRKMIEVLEQIRAGEPCENNYIIDFHILISESCGCVKPQLTNINSTVQEVYNRFQNARVRQELMCQVQSSVTNMSSISELPTILIEKFVFETISFAVNDDIFREPDFGLYHRGKQAYSDNIHVLYQRNNWAEATPCIIKRTDLVYNIDEMFTRKYPLIVCCVHFIDLILGYCVFQPTVSYDEYEKINSFMSAIGPALGIFHSQMHIKSINMQLKTANEEMEKLYIHDHMTGLYNRRGYYRQIQQQMEANMGKNLHVVMISADLDGLKYINDTFGHLEGDNAITTVGRALMTSALQNEICARFGGDEFLVTGVVAKANDYFESFKKRFRKYLEDYNAVSQKPYKVESSIGFCTAPLSENMNLDQMSKAADDKMYEDKTSRKKNRR